MKKEHIQAAMEKVPVPKAHKRKRHPISSQRTARFFAGILVVIGILCMLFTEQVHTIFPFILGFNMLAIGICDIYRGFKLKEYQQPETKLTANGIVMIALGFVILYHYQNADSVIGSVWGMIGLLKGTEELNLAIYHIAHHESFAKKLIEAIIELLLALILLIDPLTAVEHHLFLLGIELILHGAELFAEARKIA